MQSNKWEVEKGKKVCYFDIDGVLNNYPECWLRFIKEYSSEMELSYGPIDDLNIVKHKIPYQIYKDLKWEYRESGYKETIPVNPDASRLTSDLRERGYYIVIITSRPIKTHPSLFKQTLNWLQKNNIEFDDLIFDESKDVIVSKKYPQLILGVEDHRYYANLVASWGYDICLINNRYNSGEILPNVHRIDRLIDVLEWIK